MTLTAIISIIILVFSVIIHEVSHGYMADLLGDPTAKLQGRLTLNPLKHIDPIGSILVPIITSMAGFTFGWAKPVPYNPYNLKNKRIGEVLIAAVGPLSNITIAVVFGLLMRYSYLFISPDSNLLPGFFQVTTFIVVINIVLAVFNLIPLPPLDGSKFLFAIIPDKLLHIRHILEAYAPFWVLIVVFFLWQVMSPIIPVIFNFITGYTVML